MPFQMGDTFQLSRLETLRNFLPPGAVGLPRALLSRGHAPRDRRLLRRLRAARVLSRRHRDVSRARAPAAQRRDRELHRGATLPGARDRAGGSRSGGEVGVERRAPLPGRGLLGALPHHRHGRAQRHGRAVRRRDVEGAALVPRRPRERRLHGARREGQPLGGGRTPRRTLRRALPRLASVPQRRSPEAARAHGRSSRLSPELPPRPARERRRTSRACTCLHSVSAS